MDMDCRKPTCPILDVDGVISGGKQFDLDITLPEDNRDVIYGVVKNCFKEPVSDAVVKLVEVVYDCGKDERRPIGHTFTDEEGEFVFGPLCPGKKYALQIWVNDTRKIKICTKCCHEGRCLKGEKCEKCDCFLEGKPKREKYYYDEKPCYDKKDDYDDKKCCDKKDYCCEKKCCDKKDDCCEKKCCDKKDDCCERKCCDKKDDYDDKKCCDKKDDCCEKKCCDKKDDYDEKKCYDKKPCYEYKHEYGRRPF